MNLKNNTAPTFTSSSKYETAVENVTLCFPIVGSKCSRQNIAWRDTLSANIHASMSLL
jgi:hypothetical protein